MGLSPGLKVFSYHCSPVVKFMGQWAAPTGWIWFMDWGLSTPAFKGHHHPENELLKIL